jgi:predicted acylesterase/phospholipase RssA
MLALGRRRPNSHFIIRVASMLGAAALGVLAACAVNHRPPATPATIMASGAGLAAAYRATIDSVVERLARRAVARGDRTLDILLLSGGGQNGAYGAGFLRGWKSRHDAPMPQFDLVTGVSTGTLQAPFAFLGNDAALDSLSALYLRAADRIAPTIDWFFWLRRTGGVVKTDRYRATIRSVVDARLVDSLRAAFRADRQFLVATTDFDLATGRIWDIARELDTTATAAVRIREIFYASTAIPGIFPPTTLDGHVHADGGVISNILVPLTLDDYRKLAQRLEARGVTEPVTVRVWIVLNLWTHMPPQVLDPSSRKDMSARTSLLMLSAQHPQIVQALDALAQAVTTGVPGLELEARYTAIPVSLSTEPAASKLFDKGFMQRLETLGYERARGATPWDSTISAYARP